MHTVVDSKVLRSADGYRPLRSLTRKNMNNYVNQADRGKKNSSYTTTQVLAGVQEGIARVIRRVMSGNKTGHFFVGIEIEIESRSALFSKIGKKIKIAISI